MQGMSGKKRNDPTGDDFAALVKKHMYKPFDTCKKRGSNIKFGIPWETIVYGVEGGAPSVQPH